MGYGIQGNAAGSMQAGKNRTPSGYSSGQVQNFTPEAMQLYQQLFQHVSPGSYLSRLAGGDEDIFNQIEKPAMRQFNQLQGQNASRFSGMGLGARKGSGFMNSQNQITSDFAQDLQSRRQSLSQQAIKELMGMSGDLLKQKPYENYLVPKNKPWWQEALAGIGQTAVKAGVESAFKGASGFGG